jgi:predicted nuclease of predicted toxin-antitoxin system
MKFLLDANVEYRLATHLLSLEHDVKTIAGDYPSALEDTEVLSIAVKEKRILLTNDRDYGELIFRQQLPHHGILYFRLKYSKDISMKLQLLDTVLDEYKDHLQDYLVVTPNGVKIRKADFNIQEQKKAA